jgi:hypothetical protein
MTITTSQIQDSCSNSEQNKNGNNANNKNDINNAALNFPKIIQALFPHLLPS